MYSIIAIILLIIILIEFYEIFKNSKLGIKNKSSYNKIENENEKFLPFKFKYNRYSVKGDKLINHSSGYIYLKENYNFFIREKNKTLFAKKNKIYKINSDFTVEVLDVNGKNIFYYYIKSQ